MILLIWMNFQKKMLESRPEDALVKHVKLVKLYRLWRLETVEIVETVETEETVLMVKTEDLKKYR